MKPSLSRVICLMGPTASGKTALAIELTKRLPCQIVSVDSAMVYRGMDIGTAKPSLEERAVAPHRLIDICDPTHAYSVGQFCIDAHQAIIEIQEQGQIPLLVGGTMLYFWALQQGIADLPSGNPAIRQELLCQAQIQGWAALHQRLQEIDPVAAAHIHPHDKQRIQRALEVYELTGTSLSRLQTAELPLLSNNMVTIVLAPASRQLLHERIAQRRDNMFDQGLIAEVLRLHQRKDLHKDLPALRMVGYRQVWEYLEGEYNEATLRDRVLFATRQFAKRQLTWLRRWQHASWCEADDPKLMDAVIAIING